MTDVWRATEEGMWLPHPPVPQVGGGRRILHLATRFLHGGAERNIAHSVAWERAAGFEVELAFGPDADVAAVPDAIPTHEVPALQRSVGPRDVAAVRQVRNLIKTRRYDIVHTHLSKAGIVGRLAARGVADRVIHTVHMSSFGPGYNRAASAIYRSAERACARMADVIVFVGSELRDDYVDAGVVTRERTRVIHSPMDLAPFLASRSWTDAERAKARADLGVPAAGPLVLTIGTLEPRKRQELIVRRLAEWLKTSSGYLLIAGDGPMRTRLSEVVDELGLSEHVLLAGHVRDVPAAIAVADVVVHASAAEGVPQVVIQAVAAGRPVVATAVSGLGELSDAAVHVVSRDGRALPSALDAEIGGLIDAIAPNNFERWACPSIDRSMAHLHSKAE